MRDLTSNSIQVGKAGIIVFIAVFLNKILSVLKEILVAYKFGVSSDLDVFNIAMVLPGFILLFLTAAFTSAFVPMYIEWKTRYSNKKVEEYSLSILYNNIVLFTLLALIGYISAPYLFPLLGYGLDQNQVDLGITLQRWLIIMFIIDGCAIILLGIFHANKQFFYYSTAPIFINVCLILFLLFGDGMGIHALVFGFLTGNFIKLVYLYVNLKRHRFSFITRQINFDIIKTYYLLALPMIGSEVIAQSNFFVDQIMATQLDPGSVSSLTYAFRVYALPNVLIIMVISQTLLPYLSQLVSAEDFAGFRNMLKNTVIFVGFISFPIIALFLLFSNEIISILFERGEFDIRATDITGSNLFYYSFGMFFHAFTVINGSFLVALRNTKPLILIASIAFILNITFNLIFMSFMDVNGLALSTSVTIFFIFIIAYLILIKLIKFDQSIIVFKNIFLILFMSILIYILGYFILYYTAIDDSHEFVYIAVISVICIVAYFAFLWIFRTKEIESCFYIFIQLGSSLSSKLK